MCGGNAELSQTNYLINNEVGGIGEKLTQELYHKLLIRYFTLKQSKLYIMIKANDLELERTCYACPEQYDVLHNDVQVGYLRLRHGHFRAECNDVVVYETSECEGDGIFEYEERDKYLNLAKQAICDTLNVDQVDSKIDWEQVFDNAQTMHLQEFINHYKNK